jgi:predicted secreted acid phosphatase
MNETDNLGIKNKNVKLLRNNNKFSSKRLLENIKKEYGISLLFSDTVEQFTDCMSMESREIEAY